MFLRIVGIVKLVLVGCIPVVECFIAERGWKYNTYAGVEHLQRAGIFLTNFMESGVMHLETASKLP